MMVVAFVLALILNIHKITATNTPIVVHTQYGDVLGYQTDLARVFYGIPFAKPPIGPLRWEPPVPITPWYPNMINATQPAPACAQPEDGTRSIRNSISLSEDCLYLNIFSPLLSNSQSEYRLPVMIFIHGGNFQFENASESVFESERLANTTNVVIVLIQYRLGVLGFLATGEGPNDIKGNYGVLDQRLAVEWIKTNIDVFGGDQNEITLFGESAGAQSVALHYVTNEMQSYFQRAIIQSSPMTIPFKTYSEYVTPTVLLAEQLHCSIGDIECFRARTTEQIITAQGVVNDMLTSLNILLFFEPWIPVIDNVIVRGQLLESIQNVTFPLKPLMIGTVTDEGWDFIYGTWQKPMPAIEYMAIGIAIFKENAWKVAKQYPPDGSGDQRTQLARLTTQWVFACSTRVFARKAASFSYVFGYPFDGENSKSSVRCSDHACHGDELPFVFESEWYKFTDVGRRLSESMATYWTNFAKSENPNGPSRVPLIWPPVTSSEEEYMYLQDPLQIRGKYLKDDCDFWDQIGYKNNLFSFD